MKKRVYALLLAMGLMVGLCACGGDPTEETAGSTVGTSTPAPTETQVTKPTEQTQPTEATKPTEVTEPSEEPTEPATEEATAPVTQPDVTEAPTQPPVTEAPTQETEPIQEGPSGTKDDPIYCRPDTGDTQSYTVTLSAIPGNSSLYFNVYGVGGVTITINDANAYVVLDGTRYTAQNGSVQLVAPSDVMADQPILMEIGNTASSAKAFVLNCQAPQGTVGAPHVLTAMNGAENAVSLAKGNDQGYIYTYTAENSGTIRLTLISETAKTSVIFDVTNTSTMKNVTNKASVGDFEGDYVEIEVTAGDVIQIIVQVEPDTRGIIKKSDAVWSGSYI